jgi:pyruvate carboxylase subunit B
VNVVGLDSQSSDIIDLHAKLFKKHGITTIRNFDALNDVDNLIPSGRAIKAAGLNHEVAVTLMSLPPGTPGDDQAHTPEFYTATLKQILGSGSEFDSVVYKDASGTSTPKTVYDSIKQARAILPPEIPIRFHSHDTVGTCIAQYTAALEAGASGIDLSMAPVSGGTCQSDVISMWHALRGTEYDLGIDIDKMREAEEVLKDCMKDYFLPPESKAVEPMIPFSPMPGGALTANTQMLRDNGIMDRYQDIIEKMPEVVKLGGFGTSVTPVSQFYFQQAFNNAMFGDWEKIAEGYGKMVLGYFGKTPMKPEPRIVEIAAKQLGLEPTDRQVVDINDADPNKGVAAARAMLEAEGLDTSDENIFIAPPARRRASSFSRARPRWGSGKKPPKALRLGRPATAAGVTGSAWMAGSTGWKSAPTVRRRWTPDATTYRSIPVSDLRQVLPGEPPAQLRRAARSDASTRRSPVKSSGSAVPPETGSTRARRCWSSKP